MATPYDRVNPKYLEFDNIRQRGSFYFAVTKYKDETLTIETPALITPTGIQSDASRNWMDLELDVAENPAHQKLYDTFKLIDDTCIDETIQNMDKWFPKSDVDERFIEEQYKSPVTAGWGNEPALLRIEIGVENPEDLMDARGNVISPNDVTALSQVVVTLQLLGMWVSEKFLGCHWRATRIVANLDHESKGRRRSSSPRRQSPLPPVTARGAQRRKQAEPTEQQPSQSQEPKAAPKRQTAPKATKAPAKAPAKRQPAAQSQAAPQAPKRSVAKEDPKIQQMLDKLRAADDDDSDHDHHRRRHSDDDDDRRSRRHHSDSESDDSDRDYRDSHHSSSHYHSRDSRDSRDHSSRHRRHGSDSD